MNDSSVRLRVADYATDFKTLRQVRFAVFVDEQGVPPEIEMDDRDPLCLHVVAYDGARPIGTGRIDLERAGRIGRVAVLAGHRRRGAGRAIMEALHELAVLHDLTAVWCHAQLVAVPFYERLGYETTGEPFEEAGIAHVRMDKRLLPDRA